jgi:arylsulfatase A-like enzyme
MIIKKYKKQGNTRKLTGIAALLAASLMVKSCESTVASKPSSGDSSPARIEKPEDVDIISEDSPNIVWIVLDHVTFHHYKKTEGAKPVLNTYERIAQAGIEFERAYSVQPLCSPARASMFTGMFSIRHGVLTNDTADHLGGISQFPTYNKYLQRNGYATGFFGKNHAFNGSTESMGFEGWSPDGYGQPYTSQAYDSYLKKKGFYSAKYVQEWAVQGGEKGKTFDMAQVSNFNGPSSDGYRAQSAGYFTNVNRVSEGDMLISMTMDYIDECVTGNKKFFVALNTWGPHPPYQVSSDVKGTIAPAAIAEYPNFDDPALARPSFVRQYLQNQRAATQLATWAEWQPVMARAYETYTSIDKELGKLLDHLETKGLTNKTLVILTADHGDEAGSHGGLIDKAGNLSEEAMHIPMVMMWPDRIGAGKKSNALVSNVDIVPTVIEAGGLRPPAHMDGKSLVPVFNGNESNFQEFMAFHFGHHSWRFTQRALYYGDYKYIATAGDKHELYKITADPFELEDLINKPAEKEIAAQMKSRMLNYMDRIGDNKNIKDVMLLRSELR